MFLPLTDDKNLSRLADKKNPWRSTWPAWAVLDLPFSTSVCKGYYNSASQRSVTLLSFLQLGVSALPCTAMIRVHCSQGGMISLCSDTPYKSQPLASVPTTEARTRTTSLAHISLPERHLVALVRDETSKLLPPPSPLFIVSYPRLNDPRNFTSLRVSFGLVEPDHTKLCPTTRSWMQDAFDQVGICAFAALGRLGRYSHGIIIAS